MPLPEVSRDVALPAAAAPKAAASKAKRAEVQ
jgi:hypothetical protein